MLDFAASYNSYNNLRLRMQHVPPERVIKDWYSDGRRDSDAIQKTIDLIILTQTSLSSFRPPLNLLRQELTGTSIYLDALQKTASGIHNPNTNRDLVTSPHHDDDDDDDDRVKVDAEEKLASFCGQVLKEASDFQSSIGDANNMEIHQVLELRSPIVVKVLKGMCSMDNKIFRRHLESFYPLITKLVCCDQMDVRCALADLFSMQLHGLIQ